MVDRVLASCNRLEDKVDDLRRTLLVAGVDVDMNLPCVLIDADISDTLLLSTIPIFVFSHVITSSSLLIQKSSMFSGR
jgi:hypothetical protein